MIPPAKLILGTPQKGLFARRLNSKSSTKGLIISFNVPIMTCTHCVESFLSNSLTAIVFSLLPKAMLTSTQEPCSHETKFQQQIINYNKLMSYNKYLTYPYHIISCCSMFLNWSSQLPWKWRIMWIEISKCHCLGSPFMHNHGGNVSGWSLFFHADQKLLPV